MNVKTKATQRQEKLVQLNIKMDSAYKVKISIHEVMNTNYFAEKIIVHDQQMEF